MGFETDRFWCIKRRFCYIYLPFYGRKYVHAQDNELHDSGRAYNSDTNILEIDIFFLDYV